MPQKDSVDKIACFPLSSDLKKLEAGVTRKLLMLMTVKQWLEHIYTISKPTATGTDYWLYTRKRIRELLYELPGGRLDEQLVTEADPDAPFRLSKSLAPEDYKNDSIILKDAFQYIRAGLFGEALLLLEKCGQYWRSALFRGSILSNNTALDEYTIQSTGNSNRIVWKDVVQKIINDPDCDIHERAILSYLSGNLDNLLPVCTSWEDKVWAYYSCSAEQEISSIIGETQPGGAVRKNCSPDAVFNLVRLSIPPYSAMSPKDFFYFIQEHLIVDKLDEMFKLASDIITRTPNQNPLFFHPGILRHLSSLAIVLMKNQIIKEGSSSVSKILETYSQSLLDANKIDLAPFYLSFVDKLIYLKISSDFIFKSYTSNMASRFLAAAKKCKLDYVGICINLFIQFAGGLKSQLSQISNICFDYNVPLHESEILLSKIVEWISCYPEARTDFIFASNFLMGSYLASDRIKAANNVVETISKSFGKHSYLEDIVSPNISRVNIFSLMCKPDIGIKAIIVEHIGYLALIDCISKHSKWQELYETYTQHLGQPDSALIDYESEFVEVTRENESNLRNFVFSSDLLLKHSNRKAENCLPGSQECSPSLYSLVVNSRRNLVHRVWQLYLPVVVLFLCEVLTKTVDLFPRYEKARAELHSYICHTAPPTIKAIIEHSELHAKIMELVSC